LTHKERVALIDLEHTDISIDRQAELLDISRSSIYYKPKVSDSDIPIMHRIDEIFTKSPFYGSRRVCVALTSYDLCICRDHVRRLMHLMGLEAIYPKKNTSKANKQRRKYPYLLRNITAGHPNHIWGTDITYIRLENGFCYLVVHLDWYSRYVISWEVSETLETTFCTSSLNNALLVALPIVHNSDQGVQFTSNEYTDVLTEKDIKISMDGRGRCMDNIFTERLWRTVKYENVFLKSYGNIDEARKGLSEYFNFYNTERPHQSLDYRTPAKVFFDKS
jgi:putative transposase